MLVNSGVALRSEASSPSPRESEGVRGRREAASPKSRGRAKGTITGRKTEA